jgi:hypothetical protein
MEENVLKGQEPPYGMLMDLARDIENELRREEETIDAVIRPSFQDDPQVRELIRRELRSLENLH